MSAWDSDDLAIMFDDDMPRYRAAQIGSTTVGGAFRAKPGDAFDGLAGGNTPQFRCSTATLPTLSRGLSVTVNGTAYTVSDWDSLPEGVTVIALEKVVA